MVGVHFYPCRAIARSWDGKRIYVGHSHACFRKWGDRCLSTVSVPLLLLSLTAPPTASSYIIPSPFFRAAACIYWLISLFFNLCIFYPTNPRCMPHSLTHYPQFLFQWRNVRNVDTRIFKPWMPGWIRFFAEFLCWYVFTRQNERAGILRKDSTSQDSTEGFIH